MMVLGEERKGGGGLLKGGGMAVERELMQRREGCVLSGDC